MNPLKLSFLRASLRVFVLASLLLAGTAHARLGETPEQCVTRYGNAFGKIPGRVVSSGEMMSLYDKVFVNSEGFKVTVRVRVEFHNGKAWYIRYSGHYKDRDRQELMARNLPDDTWSEPETYMGRSFWTSKRSPKSHATLIRGGENYILEVMTDDCAKALADQKIAQTKTILGDTAYEPASKPESPSGPASSTPPADPSDKPAAATGSRNMEGF